MVKLQRVNDGKRRIIVFYKSTATRIRRQNTELCFIGEIWNPFDEFQFDSARIQRSIFHFKCVVPGVLLHDSSNIDFSIILNNRQSSRGNKVHSFAYPPYLARLNVEYIACTRLMSSFLFYYFSVIGRKASLICI